MPFHRTTLITLALLAGAGGGGAAAQVTTREVTTAVVKDPALFSRPPIASMSITPYQRSGTFEGGQVVATFYKVSLLPANNNDIVLHSSAKSYVLVSANQLANGIYSVRFSFGQVAPAATVTIRDETRVIATCALQEQLQASSTPTQLCQASGIEVAGGKLSARLEHADGSTGDVVFVSQITVNRHF
jgi:hypothetical protein